MLTMKPPTPKPAAAATTAQRPDDEAMYGAFVDRNPECDGVFFVGVKTTGIFCRPTCSAKKPRRENVEFFHRASDALHAGYRPCKRCRPMDSGRPVPDWVDRLRTRVDEQPHVRLTDADLREMEIVPSTARSFFKKTYGMTFHAYARSRRLGSALHEIRNGQRAETTGYRNGYQSASGFRGAFAKMFGRSVGRGRHVRTLTADWIDTPLGAMLAVADDDGLRLLEFVDRRAMEHEIVMLRKRLAAVIVPGHHRHLSRIGRELADYFAGRDLTFNTPVAPVGSEFQTAVWEALVRIPPGRTRSYAQLAAEIGRTGACRAIGRANGSNAIAIVIPCHRVIAADGTLCGYGGGLWRKQWLLDHERCHVRGPVADNDR